MLIIFDLDDTLIDTSGMLTPRKLEHALARMMAKGLHVKDSAAALSQLLRLNSFANSAKEALMEFLEILDAPKEFLEIGLHEVYENIGEDLPVLALDGAADVLLLLRETHELALVTAGRYSQQMAKLKNSGIDSTLFSRIVVVEDRDKKPHYQRIAEELGYLPSQVVVCGDRIAADLAPAKELGFRTVQMCWGRGKRGQDQVSSAVDVRIDHLKDILDFGAKL